MHRVVWGVMMALLLVVLVLAGCGSDANEEGELPAARPLLAAAAQKVQNAASFRMDLAVQGYPVEIHVAPIADLEDMQLTFQYAKGEYVAPNRLQAKAEFKAEDMPFPIELRTIGDTQYMMVLNSEQWVSEQFIPEFSAQALMAPDSGLAHALTSLSGLEMVGRRDLDGLTVYHLRGNMDAAGVNALTFGLIGPQTGQLTADVYILPEERWVDQIILHEPLPAGVQNQEPTTWTITLRNYNTAITIDEPPVAGSD